MKTVRSIVLLLGLAALAALPIHAANFTVQMSGFQFVPRNLTIGVGDTVTWVNSDSTGHDTVSGTNGVPNNIWRSPLFGLGGRYSFTFTNIPLGSYGYYCTPHVFSFDMRGSINVLPPNTPPTVAITSPTNGAFVPSGTPLLVQASAADSDGTISRVDFFANTTLFSRDSVAPYAGGLLVLPGASYALRAVAVDNRGTAVTSAVVNVTVIVPPSIVTPPQSTNVLEGQAVAFRVVATGAAPLSYQWRFNSNNIPDATNSLFVINAVTTNDAGNYVVVVRNPAASVTSSPATLSVTANNPPLISLINPTNGTKFPLGAPVIAAADASDNDGTVASVEFFLGNNSVGVVTNPPWSLVLSNLPAGTYELTARATDDRDSTSTASPVTFSVHEPPALMITQPEPGARFPAGTNVTLEATVGETGAQLLKVEFFEGSTRIVKLGAPPFRFDWLPTVARDYFLTAVAMDELGQSGTSAPVRIRVFIPEKNRPTVAITNGPANFARVTSPLVSLAGVAGDDIGVDRVEVQVSSGPFASEAGQIAVAEGTTHWAAQVMLSPGNNAVRVRSVDLAENTSFDATRFFTLETESPLTVLKRGDGAVTPALNGRALRVGRIYSITAVPAAGQVFAGWEGAPGAGGTTLNFVMQSNLVLTANFVTNPFAPVQGSYVGLFLDTNNVAPESSGFFNLRVNSRGQFSGQLMMNGSRHSFRGQFDVLGRTGLAVMRPHIEPVVLTLFLDLTDGTDRVTGEVSNGSWTSALRGDRNVFNAKTNAAPQTGWRTFGLRNESDASGVGTGIASVSAGGFTRLGGALANGRRFGLGTALAKNGDSPFYVTLGRGPEVMFGWLNLADPPEMTVTGDLFWMKSGTNGFSVQLEAVPTAP